MRLQNVTAEFINSFYCNVLGRERTVGYESWDVQISWFPLAPLAPLVLPVMQASQAFGYL